jgi:hypothetical protein
MADQTELAQALIVESHRIEEDALYSSKGHFEAARSWQNRNLWIGIPTTAGAALAAGTAIADYALAAGVISAITAVGSALLTWLGPSEKAAAHLAAGNAFNALRNQVRIFREIDSLDPELESRLAPSLRELATKRDELNQASPQIPRAAFERARKGIEAGEAEYKIDSSK